MLRLAWAVLALLVAASAAISSPSTCSACRFAKSYSAKDLFNDPSVRESFIMDVMRWEGQFHAEGIGYNQYTGYTYDGTNIDYTTGQPTKDIHYWSAPSKESLHLMMFALALSGNKYAQTFVSPDPCSNGTYWLDRTLNILQKKIKTYEEWIDRYPGYGGYHPWVYNYDTGLVPANGWDKAVPSLDNGELVWAVYALLEGLDIQLETLPAQSPYFAQVVQLKHRYSRYFNHLAETGKTVFYTPDGILSVVQIKNNTAPPTEDNYIKVCSAVPCYLDDPYEGELFAFFLDLFSPWNNDTEREQIWLKKRNKLQSVDYATPAGPITVQRGWWFSSHEQWKYLELPYLKVDINRRVFMNGEKARTWDSSLNSIPGMFASVSDVAKRGEMPPGYISATGIQSIAFEPVQRRDVITPYSAYPVLLADLPTGLVWYHNMLMGGAMQGPLGSTESILTNGTRIAPLVTWDSKITSVVAMLGGVSDLVAARLQKDGLYDRFVEVVNREWSLAFPTLAGENLPFQLPSITIPSSPDVPDFITCN